MVHGHYEKIKNWFTKQVLNYLFKEEKEGGIQIF